MKYGLILDVLSDVREYVVGASSVPWVPFKEDGDWESDLPRYENQTTKNGDESNGCVIWGGQNQLETLSRFLYGQEPNYSERFNYLLTPVDPTRGVDPQKGYECFRRDGLIDHKYLPMTDTLSDFLDTSDITGSLRAKGQYWLKTHDFRHEWLKKTDIDSLKENLKTCPLGVSVTAWFEQDGKYVDNGQRNNHWCLLYKIDDEGLHVFDSYDHSKKVLHPSHKIARAKRIWLNRRTKLASKSMIQLLQEVIKRLSMKPTLSSEVEKVLGLDVTPRDDTPDSVACVDVITTILKPFGVPHMVSTIEFDKWLSDPKNGFTKTTQFEEGAIVSSPTEGPRIGHVGVCLDVNGVLLIASNNSFGPNAGKITPNYTPDLWFRKFVIEKRLNMNMYKHG